MGASSLLGYARFVEPHRLECTEKPVRLASPLSQPVRVLHLSDLHWSGVVSLGFLERAFELGKQLAPDVICLTGDFVTGREMNVKEYVPVLKKLSAFRPTFASLGNHDGGSWAAHAGGYATVSALTEVLNAADITVLHNRAERVIVGSAELLLIGVGDLWAGEVNPQLAFQGISLEDPRPKVLLCHNPDAKEMLADSPWDLMLSGHTHGGQLIVPLLGAAPFAPVRDHRYVYGLCAWGSRQIHITRGVGNLHGLRINCRPEVSLLVLQ